MSKPLIIFAIALFAACIFLCNRGDCGDDGNAFFEMRIRPLLVQRCQECHGEAKQEGGLRLDSRDGWHAGGQNGSIIQAGSPDKSRLLEAVRYGNVELQMPPQKKLAANEIADLETWVQMGAPDPRDGKPVTSTADRKPLWSLQPVKDTLPPRIDDDVWVETPVDCFILDNLRPANLRPSPPADKRTLIRRATMDLTGLLPTYEAVDAFARDTSHDSYERLIEGLLASPQYGENWARHWLDVARYSDTKGYVYAREENRWVHASAYRDWVVRSLNNDLPYDQFVRMQIAADQLVPSDSPELVAMGFLTIGRRFLGVTHDVIDDRIDVVTRGILGLSVACARCHDHKYDPIPTKDYYSLYGVFQSCEEKMVPCGPANDVSFVEELAKREMKLRDTMTKRREEQSQRVRSKMDEYLLAQLELEKYPEEVFNQVVEPGDLNPFVVRKWQSYLLADKKSDFPLFNNWHQVTNETPKDQARRIATETKSNFADIENRWNQHVSKDPSTDSFADPKDERLRRVLFGPDSPCEVPNEHITNIEVYFPTNAIEELWKLQGEVDRFLLSNEKSPLYATILVDRPVPSDPRVFLRGNPLTKGTVVSRHFLAALDGGDDKPFVKGSGRLELANALVSPTNPLTARVLVNRVWMHHFGRGLVDTPSDFGNRSEIPSHPELLDWLTRRFIDAGWSIKSLHRALMLSNTYRQGNDSSSQSVDPANRMLARMVSRRLSFEQVRDAWLKSSGELDLRVGGKPIALFDKKNTRRTLYANIDREKVSPVLRMFDVANPDLSISQRTETSVPQQALFSMNHPFIAERAIQLSLAEKGVAGLYQTLFQRNPTEEEEQLAMEFILSGYICKRDTIVDLWTYGYGELDPAAKRVSLFTSLPYFSEAEWQGSKDYPDSKLGWLKLTAAGGHPGNDLKHAVIRRWTAVEDGEYSVISRLTHEPKEGDGIRGFVVHGERGVLLSSTLHSSTEQLDVKKLPIWKGDTIDFLVDIRDGLNSDQFLWDIVITKTSLSLDGGEFQKKVSDSKSDFTDPRDPNLDRWQQLAQVLMLTNEFMFVD